MQEGNYARTPVDQEDAKTILTPGQGNIKEIYPGGFARRGDVIWKALLFIPVLVPFLCLAVRYPGEEEKVECLNIEQRSII